MIINNETFDFTKGFDIMTNKYYTAEIESYSTEIKDRTVTVTAEVRGRYPGFGFGTIQDFYVTASATCHPNDTFDFATGVALATLRVEKKVNDFIFAKNEALF